MRLTPAAPAASAPGPPGAPPYSVMPLAWVGPAALADASQSSEEPPTPGKMPWALQREIRSRRGSRAGLEGGGGGVSGDALEPPLMSARDFFLAEEAPSSDAGSSKAAPELQAAAAAADAAAAVIGGPVAFARTSGVRLAENGAIEVEGLPAAEAAQMRALLDHIHRKKAAGVRVTAPPPFGGGPTPPRSPRSNGSGADAAARAVARGAWASPRRRRRREQPARAIELQGEAVGARGTHRDARRSTEQASRPVAPRADARSHEIDHGFALWVHDALTQRLHLRVRPRSSRQVPRAPRALLRRLSLPAAPPASRRARRARGQRAAGAAAVTVRLRLEYTPADLAAVDVERDATGLSVNLKLNLSFYMVPYALAAGAPRFASGWLCHRPVGLRGRRVSRRGNQRRAASNVEPASGEDGARDRARRGARGAGDEQRGEQCAGRSPIGTNSPRSLLRDAGARGYRRNERRAGGGPRRPPAAIALPRRRRRARATRRRSGHLHPRLVNG